MSLQAEPIRFWRRPRRLAAAAAVMVVLLGSCGGGAADEPSAPLPTPTPIRPTLSGSPLDAIDNDPALASDLAQSEVVAGGESALDRDAVDCEVHAEGPSTCTAAVADGGLEAIRFDDSLWSYQQDGFWVYTNVSEPYAIEEVVAATVAAARAEFAGQNQALFPHLANRRTPPPYVDVGVWSVTFLFAEDPVADPAQVKVALEGTTADGHLVDELVTYLWQWTPQRWIPEWETLTPPDANDNSDDSQTADDTSPEATDSTESGGLPESEVLEEPPAGGSWCPVGFPYAHQNGKCYANPINPNDQVGGPTISAEVWQQFVDDNG